MLNTEKFILLAGNPAKWDEETSNVKTGDIALCKLQENQSASGRLSANMVLALKGWSIRYASGLQDFALLCKSDYWNSPFDPAEALSWGTEWANQDPDNREFYVAKHDIERALEQGHNCDVLREFVIKARLEYLRGEIEAERISMDEIHELQSLAGHIEDGDVLLLEWAGVPESS